MHITKYEFIRFRAPNKQKSERLIRLLDIAILKFNVLKGYWGKHWNGFLL